MDVVACLRLMSCAGRSLPCLWPLRANVHKLGSLRVLAMRLLRYVAGHCYSSSTAGVATHASRYEASCAQLAVVHPSDESSMYTGQFKQ